MDLHQHTTHVVSQMEALLLQTRTFLDALAHAPVCPDVNEERARRDSFIQHLRNSIDLLGSAAQGYEWAVEEMLPQIASLVDDGNISDGAASLILAPAYQYLGQAYTDAATASWKND